MKSLCILVCFLLTTFLKTSKSENQVNQPPNIIFILGDDVGWNEVSFHGSPEIPTPNIDALAMSGITLNNYYAEWMCTPSRAALLSGKKPIRLGLQHFIIKAGEATGLPLDVTTMPQYLKRFGYATHMVGNWHLGHHTKAHTPTHRGFDTFFGYHNGYIDYYDYTHRSMTGRSDVPYYYGIDLYNGTDVIKDFRGQYATDVFAHKAKEIILNHDVTKPLFLYLPHAATHPGNVIHPMQAPVEKIEKFKYIKDKNRQIHAAMMSSLDDAVGVVFDALNQKDMLDNSIVVFTTDNGGEVAPERDGYASNYPLRGKKQTLWEGGVRLPATVWSPLFKLTEPRVSMQLMHVTDWLPTFYRAAGGDVNDLEDIDGFDMWDALLHNTASPRTHMLYNIDPIHGVSAFRLGDIKVINGTTDEGYNGWYGPTGFENMRQAPRSMFDWVFQNGTSSSVRNVLVENGWWIVKQPDIWYEKTVLRCQQPPPAGSSGRCNPDVKPCLFNLSIDPCEYNDVAHLYPKEVQSLMNIISVYQKTAVEPQSKPSDRDADPRCHNFTFVHWMEPEHRVQCVYT